MTMIILIVNVLNTESESEVSSTVVILAARLVFGWQCHGSQTEWSMRGRKRVLSAWISRGPGVVSPSSSQQLKKQGSRVTFVCVHVTVGMYISFLLYSGKMRNLKKNLFTKEALALAWRYFLPPYTFQIRVGALYLLYGLYNTQLCQPKQKVRLGD